MMVFDVDALAPHVEQLRAPPLATTIFGLHVAGFFALMPGTRSDAPMREAIR